MDPRSLVSDIRREIVETTAAFWQDAEIHNYMTQGERLMADLVNCTEAINVALSGVTGQSAYTVPTNVMEITRVTYDGHPLKKISYRQRDGMEGLAYGATISNGKPEYYIEQNEFLYLYPPPDTSTKEISLHHNKKPAAITTASTNFTIPDRYEHLQASIKEYCLFRMYKKDDDMQKANFHYSLWNSAVIDAKRTWNDRDNRGAIPQAADVNEFPNTSWGPI